MTSHSPLWTSQNFKSSQAGPEGLSGVPSPAGPQLCHRGLGRHNNHGETRGDRRCPHRDAEVAASQDRPLRARLEFAFFKSNLSKFQVITNLRFEDRWVRVHPQHRGRLCRTGRASVNPAGLPAPGGPG